VRERALCESARARLLSAQDGSDGEPGHAQKARVETCIQSAEGKAIKQPRHTAAFMRGKYYVEGCFPLEVEVADGNSYIWFKSPSPSFFSTCYLPTNFVLVHFSPLHSASASRLSSPPFPPRRPCHLQLRIPVISTTVCTLGYPNNATLLAPIQSRAQYLEPPETYLTTSISSLAPILPFWASRTPKSCQSTLPAIRTLSASPAQTMQGSCPHQIPNSNAILDRWPH
jgi:hypothetical protein